MKVFVLFSLFSYEYKLPSLGKMTFDFFSSVDIFAFCGICFGGAGSVGSVFLSRFVHVVCGVGLDWG